MTHKPRVLHLVDDTTAGGVMRVIDYLTTSDVLARGSDHEVLSVRRGRFGQLPRNYDVIVSHTVVSWRTLPALIALRAARPGTPLIHVEHSYTEGFVTHNVTRQRRFKSLLRIAFALFDRVVAVSHAQAAWIKKHQLCPERQLVAIQSAVDLTPFKAIEPPKGPIKVLGAIGRLDRQKGFDMLIEAFRRLPDPDLRLHIIGTGAEEQALKSLAGADDRIVFKGHSADPTGTYSSVDAVIMPSRWEAYGLVAIEAAAARRPLLCTPIDGLQDHAALGAQYLARLTPDDFAASLQQFIRNQNDPKAQQTSVEDPQTDPAQLWANLIDDCLNPHPANKNSDIITGGQTAA